VYRRPIQTPADQWLFGIGFVIRRVLVGFATHLVQFLVAILVAVRCRLFCFSLRGTAKPSIPVC
jgi:hypothetical protein